MTVITNVENLLHGGRCLVGYDDQGEYVAGWPEVARESIRAINHLTDHGPIPAPTLYRVLGELTGVGGRRGVLAAEVDRQPDHELERLVLGREVGDPESVLVLAVVHHPRVATGLALPCAHRVVTAEGGDQLFLGGVGLCELHV